MCPLGWTRNCCKRKKRDASQTPKVVFLAKITILHSLLTTCAKLIEINANIFNFREFGGRVFLSAVMYIYMTVVKGKQKLYFITHYPSVPRLQYLFLILLYSWNLNYHIRGRGGGGGGWDWGLYRAKRTTIILWFDIWITYSSVHTQNKLYFIEIYVDNKLNWRTLSSQTPESPPSPSSPGSKNQSKFLITYKTHQTHV